jgi:4-amino-4-deoxy-L-arabinose transferase-like glycosyltransferase
MLSRFAAPAASLILLAVLAVPVLLVGLGRTDLSGDEALYAATVDRMLATGSWLTPPGEHGPFLEKPPLKLWLVAAAMRARILPSHTEAGYRGLDPFLGLLALTYVWLIGRRVAGAAAGLVAAGLLLTHFAFVYVQGLRAGTMESLLVLACCGGIHHLLAWLEPRGRPIHAFAFAGWCAAGFMAKFVAIGFLPVIALIAVLLTAHWRRRVAEERRTAVLAGATALAAVAPWFALQHARYGALFWTQLSLHVIDRAAGHVDARHLRPWWFYLAELREGWRPVWPWVLAGAVVIAARTLRTAWPHGKVLLLWGVLPTLVLSLSRSKLRHYLHPFEPAFALWAGVGFSVGLRLCREAGRWTADRLRGRRGLPAFAIAMLALGLVALGVALVVMVIGPVEARVWTVSLRSSRVERPLLIAAVALLLWRGRWGGALFVLLAAGLWNDVSAPYHLARQYAEREHRPLGKLTACLCDASGGRCPPIYVHLAPGDELAHEIRFYPGRAGYTIAKPSQRVQRVARRLKDAEVPRPVVLSWPAYSEVAARVRRWPPEAQAGLAKVPLPELGLYLLLPPPYAQCATAAFRVD